MKLQQFANKLNVMFVHYYFSKAEPVFTDLQTPDGMDKAFKPILIAFNSAWKS